MIEMRDGTKRARSSFHLEDFDVTTHDGLIELIQYGMPESWDGDDSAEGIVLDYIDALEERLLAAGGTLEHWPADEQADHTHPAEEDPMPVFVIKGQDRLAADAVSAYYTLCLAQGLTDQAGQVADAVREIRDWQDRHPDLVKAPDHEHVPVNGQNWQRETSGDIPDPGHEQAAQPDSHADDQPPWTHGTHLGRGHRSVRQHLTEDHGVSQGQVDAWSDGAVHGHHDGVHRTTWAYAEDLAHPAPGDPEYLARRPVRPTGHLGRS